LTTSADLAHVRDMRRTDARTGRGAALGRSRRYCDLLIVILAALVLPPFLS